MASLSLKPRIFSDIKIDRGLLMVGFNRTTDYDNTKIY
jgi:hypothetical protein